MGTFLESYTETKKIRRKIADAGGGGGWGWFTLLLILLTYLSTFFLSARAICSSSVNSIVWCGVGISKLGRIPLVTDGTCGRIPWYTSKSSTSSWKTQRELKQRPHLSGAPHLHVNTPLLKWKSSHFRLTCFAQNRLCFSSFIRILHNLRSCRYTGKAHFSRMTFRVISWSVPILPRLSVLHTCFSSY